MKLSELEEGTEVSFELFISGKRFEFPSVLNFQRKGKAYFTPIRIEEKLLNIQDEKIHVNLYMNVEGDKPFMWREAAVGCEVYKKQVFYTMDSDSIGKKYNRRGAYRQYVGDEVFAKVGTGRPEVQVILKDISTTGFSFIYRDDPEGFENAMVYMLYSYHDDNVTFSLSLSGKIVRKQQLEDGRTLFGCALLKRNDLISRFVNYKQKEQLSRMNQTISLKDKK